MMLSTLGLGYLVMDSPLCPNGMYEPSTGQCSTPPIVGGGRIYPYGLNVDKTLPTGTGIDAAAGMVLNATQNMPGVPDTGMIQTMVGAGAPGIPITSGVPTLSSGSGLSTWVLPGIIGAVLVYALWKGQGR